MEGYSSGLRGLVANQLGQLFWCKGSNPLLSLKKKKMLKENCAAILFPYVRSLVSLLSSQTDYTKVILPVINFVNLIEDVKDEDITLESSLFIDFE